MNRYGDIDCSFKRLPPVYGYRSQKLVSIEEALQPIESQIDELPYYIKIAKKHCQFPSSHALSKDQSAAVYIYTMEWGDQTLYRVLNEALRSEDRQKLKIWFPYLKLFDKALEKLPTVKEVVWRGVSLDIGRNFTENKLVTWWSINSCSSSVNIIKSFIGNEKNSTLFLIEAINGKKISGYTENENEIILRMGTQFRVKCDPLMQSNSSHIVHLIQINDDDDDEQEEENNLTPVTNDISVIVKPSNQGASSGKSFKTKWKQNGIIVAGGNGQGNKLTQLSHPMGIIVDQMGNIYVADSQNNRIMCWSQGSSEGFIVVGGNGKGQKPNQFHSPVGLSFDRQGNLCVVESNNGRIQKFDIDLN